MTARAAGHGRGDNLEQACRGCCRSCRRGQGPPTRAETFRAEDVSVGPPLCLRRQDALHKLVLLGVCWLLRGCELAALLGEQLELDEEASTAILRLGTTKTDVAGAVFLRGLKCTCRGEVSFICTFHVALAIARWRGGKGLGPKDPRVPSRSGRCLSSGALSKAIQETCERRRASEHSPRRAGAQWHARRSAPLNLPPSTTAALHHPPPPPATTHARPVF